MSKEILDETLELMKEKLHRLWITCELLPAPLGPALKNVYYLLEYIFIALNQIRNLIRMEGKEDEGQG